MAKNQEKNIKNDNRLRNDLDFKFSDIEFKIILSKIFKNR